MELKVRGKKGFAAKLARDKADAVQKFSELLAVTDAYSGLVLLVAKVSPTGRSSWGQVELIGMRWAGHSWEPWKPESCTPMQSPLQSWRILQRALLDDSSASIKILRADYFKVGKYLELQNETDPSGRVAYWKRKGFLQHPERQTEMLRMSGANAAIYGGANRPYVRACGGSRGIFVKKAVLKRIHTARLRGSL